MRKFGAENFGDASRAAVEAMIADIQGCADCSEINFRREDRYEEQRICSCS